MNTVGVVSSIILFVFFTTSNCQRITTIQLDGVQYFVSRMNPYSPELNFFLSYQYCRSLGLQLASFETREKADSITQYLTNAGYNKYDFWTSGNNLGTDMLLWMSTGLPFNATFNYMRKPSNNEPSDVPNGSTSPQRTARESGKSDAMKSCVAFMAPNFEWDTDACTAVKDFICEQTRCYYYNYGSIPVSSAQGKPVYTTTSTVRPFTTSISPEHNKFIAMGINNLINKYRRTTSPTEKSDDVDGNTGKLLSDKSDADIEQSTNGPYDSSFHSIIELQDDPSAIVDHHRHNEDYGSTIEPDTVTVLARSFNPSSK